MYQVSLMGRPLAVNQAMAGILGFDSPEELLSSPKNFGREIWVDREARIHYMRMLKNHKAILGFECRLKCKDGTAAWVSLNTRVVCAGDGEPLYLEGFIEDIAQRKRAVEALSKSETRFRKLFDDNGSVFLLADAESGQIVEANRAAMDFFGYSRDQLRCLNTTDLNTESVERNAEMRQRAVREGCGHFNLRHRLASGEEREVEVYVSLVDMDDRPLLFCVVHDVTDRIRAESQLHASEERYRATFEQAGVGIVHTSLDGHMLRCNRHFAEMIGYTQEEVRQMTFEQVTWPTEVAENKAMLGRFLASDEESAHWEKRYLRKDGSPTWAALTVSIQHDAEGRALHLIVLAEDINSRKEAEAKLAAAQTALLTSEERYRVAFKTSLDAVNINRLSDGVYLDVNDGFLDIVGYTRDEVIGRSALELEIWVDVEDRRRMVESVRRNRVCRNLEAQFRKRSGEVLWGLMSASLIELGGVACVLSVTRDITEAKLAEEEIRNLAFYDPLTGLPNRRLLLERLSQAQASGNRSGRNRALLFIDLDNFKTLNDTLGHHTGDMLLQEVAKRILRCVRESDTVARLGGDEFVVMLEDLSTSPEDSANQAQKFGDKILDAIAQPYLLDDHECVSTSSIGITVFRDHKEATNKVLQQADIAMYQAKGAGKNTLRFFAPALQAAVNARATLEGDLRRALQMGQFVLWYQPQVDGERVVGAEALVRWNHPERGILFPGEFIPLAEETGMILALGEWVLETACRQNALWSESASMAHLKVAINISPRQFRQPNFVEHVLAVVRRTGANPENLKLELTEGMLVENVEDVASKMTQLKAHGLLFSLDDFGTGYSSLSYLNRLPLEQLKIDRSFVRDILGNASCGAIAQAIISLSKAMGLSVIAEGVESEEQRLFLVRLGCNAFQGFLISRPLPLLDFERFHEGMVNLASTQIQ
jgi:diguanylate cyclase (GGDEF)-like protein/PAS domain S-box-containing protein